MNPFVKTFIASGAIGHRLLVKFTATDGEVAQASAATDVIAGVADFPGGAKDGERVDVVLFGPAEVEYGGTVAAGKFITANSDGKAVAAAPDSGDTNIVAGRALAAASSGDIARSFINPSNMTGATA